MSVAGRISARIPPDAAVTNLAHRALLGASAPRLAGRHDHASRALMRALRATALNRRSAEETDWVRRIETRRIQLGERAWSPSAGKWSPESAWSMPRIWGRLLLRLVIELAPKSCIEMGAGFGISGIYQAAGLAINGRGRLHTLDREPTLIPVARESFADLGLEPWIEFTVGPIGETLPRVAANAAPVEYALIDAEHSEEATVYNFDTLRPHLGPGALVAIDDILSTEEMRRAWETIRKRPGNALTLNLRRLGIVCVQDPR